ncbi:hypothetical protein Ancab_031220 [Ancistrocladus abbreviatus]
MAAMELNSLKQDEERMDEEDEDPLLKARIKEAKELLKKLNEVRARMAQELLLLKAVQGRIRWNPSWGASAREWSTKYQKPEIENMQSSPNKEKQRCHFRLLHQSKNLREERQILREMKQFETTMEQNDEANDAQKSRIQQIGISKDRRKQKPEIQGNWIEAWKEQHKHRAAELTEKEAINCLRAKLFQINQKKANAHKVILDSQKQLDGAVCLIH